MVPPASHGIPRVPQYSGYSLLLSVFAYRTLTFSGVLSHTLRLTYRWITLSTTPEILLLPVWPLPLSLATTRGISVDYSSSPYLDVSVRAVPLYDLCIQSHMRRNDSTRVSPFGNPWIEGYLHLPTAYRSLSRPSSAPSAKAFPLCSC